MNSRTSLSNNSIFLLSATLLIGSIVFLKNAWVAEDAYILFRSIEQLFTGNGPIWNPHERVQVYTSPLWYFILAFTRLLSSQLFLNAIFISFALWLSTILILKSIFKDNFILLISVLLFSASTGFFDYTSSGLENSLAYLVISAFVLNYLMLFEQQQEKTNNKIFHIRVALLLYGIILCVRHDLGLILLPAIAFIVTNHKKTLSKQQWGISIAISLLPFLSFTIFSLLYYGFPFPNTAYAKLNTGISGIDLFEQGIKYFLSSIKYDSITLLLIISSLVLTLNFFEQHLKYLAYGVILNIFYIAYIGGDFMQGRLLSYAYLVSIILLLLKLKHLKFPHFKLTIVSAISLYLFLYPHTPLNSSLNYNRKLIESGIADERGFYFKTLSLYRYLHPHHDATVFPNHRWAKNGLDFKQTHHKMTIDTYIGVFGYYSGTEKIIIDILALTDPLLARLPVPGKWRIGHFKRDLPDGYIKSISKNEALIEDENLNEFYKKLKIITQSKPLFSKERLKTIFLFNLGAYDHLANNYQKK